MTDFVCIGVPYWLGEQIDGRTEVDSVRKSGLAAELGAAWVTIEPDFAAVDDPVVAVNRAIAATIEAHADKVPLIFASDCTSCIGAVKGLESKSPQVLWYDSHGDFNTPETTPSNFLGGMPLAALVGKGNQHLLEGVGLTPLPEESITLTDARNLDPGEAELVRDSAVKHLPDLQQLYDQSWGGGALYIHLDTDVVDSEEMPAMNYPEPDGPSVAETIETLRHVHAEAEVVGVLFSLWNDTLPGADKALAATLQLARAAAGK